MGTGTRPKSGCETSRLMAGFSMLAAATIFSLTLYCPAPENPVNHRSLARDTAIQLHCPALIQEMMYDENLRCARIVRRRLTCVTDCACETCQACAVCASFKAKIGTWVQVKRQSRDGKDHNYAGWQGILCQSKKVHNGVKLALAVLYGRLP